MEQTRRLVKVEEISRPWRGRDLTLDDGTRVMISNQLLLEMGFNLQQIAAGMMVVVEMKTVGGDEMQVPEILRPAQRA